MPLSMYILTKFCGGAPQYNVQEVSKTKDRYSLDRPDMACHGVFGDCLRSIAVVEVAQQQGVLLYEEQY